MDTQILSLTDFLAIGVVGAGLSFVIQWVKNQFEIDGLKTKIVTLLLAVGVGVLYYFLRETQILMTVAGILASASTVYALLLKE